MITFTTFKVDFRRSNAELAMLTKSLVFAVLLSGGSSGAAAVEWEGVGGACLVNSSMNSARFEAAADTPLISRKLQKLSKLKSVRRSK